MHSRQNFLRRVARFQKRKNGSNFRVVFVCVVSKVNADGIVTRESLGNFVEKVAILLLQSIGLRLYLFPGSSHDNSQFNKPSDRLFLQPPQQSIKNCFPIFFVDCFGQRDVHRASLHAVLRIATVGNAIVTHDAFEPFVTVHRAARMHVEVPNMRDGLRANVLVLVILRTSFEATSTGHAT